VAAKVAGLHAASHPDGVDIEDFRKDVNHLMAAMDQLSMGKHVLCEQGSCGGRVEGSAVRLGWRRTFFGGYLASRFTFEYRSTRLLRHVPCRGLRKGFSLVSLLNLHPRRNASGLELQEQSCWTYLLRRRQPCPGELSDIMDGNGAKEGWRTQPLGAVGRNDSCQIMSLPPWK